MLLSWNMIWIFKSKVLLIFFPPTHEWLSHLIYVRVMFFSTFSFQSFIELSRIRKCFTLKGGIFVLEEFGKRYPDFTYFLLPYLSIFLPLVCLYCLPPQFLFSHFVFAVCAFYVPFISFSVDFLLFKIFFVHAVLLCGSDISLAIYSSH